MALGYNKESVFAHKLSHGQSCDPHHVEIDIIYMDLSEINTVWADLNKVDSLGSTPIGKSCSGA